MPPCTMPNSAFALPRASNASRERRAQRSDSSIDCAASSRVAGYGVHSSNTIAMSESSARWICIDDLGRQQQPVAVDRRGERDALLAHLAQRAEAEHLEAAGVGEDRAAPSP